MDWRLVVVGFNLFLSAGFAFAADLVPGNWDSCINGTEPPTRVNTTTRVTALRGLFDSEGIDAYVIPNEDAHQSEYPSVFDKRRGYVSGFQGSAGFAVVTRTKAALWTDGRYFLEAEDTLDCHWILMRQGVEGVPGMTTWLKEELTNGNVVGASPFLIGSSSWNAYVESLNTNNITMKTVDPDLVDTIWTKGRPEQPNTHLYALPDEFSGRSWQDKISDMRQAMLGDDVDMMVVTSLDETAWLFNLRASDIAYNPFFISYAIVEQNRTRLYLIDHMTKLTNQTDDDPSNVTVATHLNTDASTGNCNGRTGECVEVLQYNPPTVLTDVETSAAKSAIYKVWLSYGCNYAIYSKVPKDKIVQKNTPVATTKTNKNPVERQGMKNSHIRDAVALISFAAKLEKGVQSGESWTEVSAAKELANFRREQQYNRGLSFGSISGSGSNGAIIHYSPTELTDKAITTSEMYLLDSGGQYLDGTTDVTRTFHFGQPTDYEKECYTRVMMGQIDLFQLHWPRGLYGREIEPFARAPLWKGGRVYRHGTGHGIGMFLSVHEEPGYYEKDQFGIRLENIVMVTNSSLKNTYDNLQFLTFEHITLVPYERNLIEYDMLSQDQIDYLNKYHKLCADIVGPELRSQGKTEGYDWLMARVAPIEQTGPISGAETFHTGILTLFIMYIVYFLLN